MLVRFIFQFVLAYIATLCFAVILNVPLRAYHAGGLIGATSWVLYYWMYFYLHVGLALANLLAAIVIMVLSMLAARHKKQPMILYNVPALVTFVPGGQAYKVIRYFVSGDYASSLSYLYQVVVIIGAIVLGFGLGDLINAAFFGHRWRGPAPFSQRIFRKGKDGD